MSLSLSRPSSLLALALLLAPGLAVLPSAAATPGAPAVQEPPATQALRELYTREWQWRQQEEALEYIDGRWQPGSRMPAIAPQDWQRRAARWQEVLRQLDAIPLEGLAAEERINAEVFRAMVQADYNAAHWRTWEAPFNSDSFFWGYVVPWAPYRSEAEWRRFIDRLRDLPRYFADQRRNMEAGLARGWSVPRATLDGRDRTIEPYTRTGAGNPALDVFDAIPASIPDDVRQALRAEGRKVVLEQVVPAYAGLLDYFRNDYLPRTRTSTSVRDLPGGEAFYRSQIQEYVTLDMTAAQIHQLGLAEVERISAEMRQVMARAGFQGSFGEFLQFLRTDPQFYAKSPRELIATASYIAKRIDGELNHVIGTLPRYRFTIRPVPDDIAPNYTSGRGGLESCLFNTWDLPSRPLYNLPALVLHECAPGHSLQAALALEAPARPEFRQQAYFSGYGEGWGLYTEWLGTQMGIYETPYEEFGRLTFEMWRAARLVIDTGLHEYGWSRQQAIDYLASHTALAHHDIVNEVDRYISWPGQALSYYIGYRTLLDLRREAERELGPAFDQKAFHDRVLGLGAVPLGTLEREIRGFIAEGGRRPETATPGG